MLNSSLNTLANYCEVGELQRLKTCLDSKAPFQRKEIISKKTVRGSTCLLISCKKGHIKIIRYLLEDCLADIEQVGSVKVDSEIFEGVTPLWCAAAMGSLETVKLLLHKKAQINKTTLTNSTPLRAACYDGHEQVVRLLLRKGADAEIANRYGHTCLMVSCFRGHSHIVEALLEHGARINRQGARGITALHECAETGNTEMYKLLRSHDALVLKDDFGVTPLVTAANAGHTNFIQDLKNETSLIEHAEAYELIGSHLVDCKLSICKAIVMWKQAMYIRIGNTRHNTKHTLPPPGLVGRSGKEKWPIHSPDEMHKSRHLVSPGLRDLSDQVFHGVKEFCSLAELSTLEDIPELVRLQSLLIRLRIMGPDHPDTISFLRKYGAAQADAGDVGQCLKTWRFVLELQRLFLEPLDLVIQGTFLGYAEVFSYVLADCYHSMPAGDLEAEQLVMCLEFCGEAILRGCHHFYSNQLDRPWSYTPADKEAGCLAQCMCVFIAYCHLILMNYDIDDDIIYTGSGRVRKKMPISVSTNIWFHRCVYRVLSANPRCHENLSLLHLACRHQTGSHMGLLFGTEFPSAPVIHFLLSLDTDPNVASADGVRPINIILKYGIEFPQAAGVMLKLLVQGGAHLDCRGGRSRLLSHTHLSAETRACVQSSGIHPLKYISLQCLAATTLRKTIARKTWQDLLPTQILHFVDMH